MPRIWHTKTENRRGRWRTELTVVGSDGYKKQVFGWGEDVRASIVTALNNYAHVVMDDHGTEAGVR